MMGRGSQAQDLGLYPAGSGGPLEVVEWEGTDVA